MKGKWQDPILVASAALVAGSAALAAENSEDLRVFSFVGLAAGLILLGVWLGGEEDE